MSNATVTELGKVSSHAVSDDWSNGARRATREELYATIAGTWRGRPVEIRVSADRYTSSDDVWSDWRIYPTNVVYTDTSGLEYASETARTRLREESIALLAEWLESDAYPKSRKEAFGWMLRNRLRDDAGSVYGSRPIVAELLDRYRDEVAPELAERIERGIAAIETLREVLG